MKQKNDTQNDRKNKDTHQNDRIREQNVQSNQQGNKENEGNIRIIKRKEQRKRAECMGFGNDTKQRDRET